MLTAWEVGAVGALLMPSVYLAGQIETATVLRDLKWAGAGAVACFCVTVFLIPAMAPYFRARLFGYDRGKGKGKDGSTTTDDHRIPSAVGLVCGAVYMVFIILTQLVYARDQPALLSNYNAALLSICFMILLGFVDDVLDLPWRFKLILPTIASLPLLVTYTGGTSVLMPLPVRPLLYDAATDGLTWFGRVIDSLATVDVMAHGAIIDLGALYFVYMGMLAVFSTNTINIYAGINGLEAGQSLIIAVAILTANVYELTQGVGGASPHLFSALLALPFIGTTLGMLVYNTYPATVFVGDTYCYFAGMTFAVMAILGHFSKTLLLFFIPQIVNFLLSLPQLFKVVPCPRHRMPDYDPASDRLLPSTFPWKNGAGEVVYVTNFTVINALLRFMGPLHERTATNLLLLLQVACCMAGLWVRYRVSLFVYAGAHDGVANQAPV